jgi:hypothetical protein
MMIPVWFLSINLEGDLGRSALALQFSTRVRLVHPGPPMIHMDDVGAVEKA